MKSLVAAVSLLFACMATAQEAEPTAAPSLEQPLDTQAQPSEKSAGFKWPVERRQTQTRTEAGYLAAPVAANIPGLGFFYGLLASYFNILGSEADFFGFKVWGDLEGMGFGTLDIPLLWEPLTFGVFYAEQRASVDVYDRGMDSDGKDFRRIKIDRFGLLAAQVALKLFEKRFQFYLGWNRQISQGGTVYDSEGKKLAETSDEQVMRINKSYYWVFDLTDDRSDPRKGVSLEVQRYDRPKASDFESDFYVMDYNLTAYVPMFERSTWAFNLYRSDAVVTRTGETNRAAVEDYISFDCSTSKGKQRETCEEKREQTVSETLAENRHGTASGIGGTQRLRSYTTNRYYGAHSLHLGTEFRWNLTQEFTPFNYFVAGGVRSGLQFAFFAEYGGVADLVEDLGKKMAYSVGAGFRLLIASGFVFRFDIAGGKEGIQPTIIFSYPWALF